MSSEFIIGLSMGLINILKKYIPEKAKDLLPIICLAFIVTINCGLAYFNKTNIVEAGKEALINGGIALGLFTAGTYTARASKAILDSKVQGGISEKGVDNEWHQQ